MTTTVKAADLPSGSVVATRKKAWIKDYIEAGLGDWYETDSEFVAHDADVQEALDQGAVVLREGYGDVGSGS